MKTSKFNLYCGFGLLGFLMFFLLLPIAQAEVCPAIGHPKDFTVLLEDPLDRNPLGDRTPLILIHGIHGDKKNANYQSENIQDHNPNYWFNFSQFFYYWGASSSSVLKDKFKLYYFFYQSNKICVNDIANGLRDWIDERTNQQQGTANKLQDVPFVIIAHSMGGLVSRAFMNKFFHLQTRRKYN